MCIENKKTYILYVLDVLREYSDEEHRLSQKAIVDLLRKYYDIDIERRTVKSCVMNLIDTGYDSYIEALCKFAKYTDFSCIYMLIIMPVRKSFHYRYESYLGKVISPLPI